MRIAIDEFAIVDDEVVFVVVERECVRHNVERISKAQSVCITAKDLSDTIGLQIPYSLN